LPSSLSMSQDSSILNQTDCEFMNRVGATPHLLKSPLCTDWNPNVGDDNSGGCIFVRGACLRTYTLLDSTHICQRCLCTYTLLDSCTLLSHKHCLSWTCTGCNLCQHRQIVFTVDLVLHESAFPTPPSAGETVACVCVILHKGSDF